MSKRKLVFHSPINMENSFNSWRLADNAKCIMTLHEPKDANPYITWEIPELEMEEEIGLTFYGKRLADYDGVFELPREAIKLLRQNGYVVPRDFY